MKRALVAAVLLLCSVALAKKNHAPLPDGVLQAKTIYLVNRTGKQAVLDSAYDEFQRWGRFTLTQNKDADLLVILSHVAGGDEQGATQMEIHVRGDEEAAFETTEAITSSPGLATRFVLHDASARRCVDDFKKRLSE